MLAFLFVVDLFAEPSGLTTFAALKVEKRCVSIFLEALAAIANFSSGVLKPVIYGRGFLPPYPAELTLTFSVASAIGLYIRTLPRSGSARLNC